MDFDDIIQDFSTLKNQKQPIIWNTINAESAFMCAFSYVVT